MGIKYYKKLSPKTAVRFGQFSVAFPTLDNITGYYATLNEGAQAQLQQYIEQQQYGLTEISQADYEAEYLEKKKNGTASPPRQFREEIGAKGLSSGSQTRSLGDTAAKGAAVVRTPSGGIARFEQPVTISESADAPAGAPAMNAPAIVTAPSQFQPSVGKRA